MPKIDNYQIMAGGVRYYKCSNHFSPGTSCLVRDVGCMFDDHERVLKKQLSRGVIPEGGVLHCFKRLKQ